VKPVFVRTSNWERFQRGLEAVEGRGAPEACWLLVTGEPGLGKSSIVTRWAVDQRAAFVTAQPAWTVSSLFNALAGALRTTEYSRLNSARAHVCGLVLRQQLPIVVDEADHLARSFDALEALRGLSDLCKTPVVIVGMERIQKQLERFPQVSSRIASVVTFEHVTEADVARACREMSEVEIAPEVVAEIHRQCGGRMRLVLNAIATCERVGKASGAKRVELKDVGSVELAHDWQSRRPAMRKAAAA
jgi:hypothetical protein